MILLQELGRNIFVKQRDDVIALFLLRASDNLEGKKGKDESG